MFQQDGARPHMSKMSENAFEKAGISLLKNNEWPLNSPDLSPIDYFLWNQVANQMPKKNFRIVLI